MNNNSDRFQINFHKRFFSSSFFFIFYFYSTFAYISSIFLTNHAQRLLMLILLRTVESDTGDRKQKQELDVIACY